MGVWLRKSSHRIHGFAQMFCCVNSPTEFTDLHRWLGCVGPPTEFTEVWGCCWLRGYGRMPYPPNLCASVPICGRYFSARRFCVFRGFCGRCFSARRFCVFRAFCGIYPCLFCWCSSCSGRRQSRAETTGFRRQRGYGRMPYPPNLCASVPICGRCFSARRFRVFCAFCGRFFSTRRVRSVGGTSQPDECVPWATTVSRCGSV